MPVDAAATGAGRLGFVWRVPFGVVGAITPFNAPINLLVQKVAPAIAAGNAVVVKPALVGDWDAFRARPLEEKVDAIQRFHRELGPLFDAIYRVRIKDLEETGRREVAADVAKYFGVARSFLSAPVRFPPVCHRRKYGCGYRGCCGRRPAAAG